MFESLLELDRSVLLFFNQAHTLYWDQVMWIYTGRLVWIPLLLSMLYVAFRSGGWREALWMVTMAVVVVVLCDQVSSSIFKPLVARYRPTRDPDFSYYVTLVHGYRGGLYGFFSSHASNAAGIVMFTVLLFRNRFYTVASVVWALLICYSRLYLGVHYPGDILVGLLWGSLVGYGGYLLYRSVRPALFGHSVSPYADCREVRIINIVLCATFLFILATAPLWKFSLH